MKMDTKLYNELIAWAEKAEEGDNATVDGRKAEVTNMAGGKFLLSELYDPYTWVDPLETIAGQTDSVEAVAIYLITGKVYNF